MSKPSMLINTRSSLKGYRQLLILCNRGNMKKPINSCGFTLIELMIAMAIIAILAAVAYPSYQQYVVRANRTAVQTFMLGIANKQEQFILDRRQYATGASINAVTTSLNIAPPENKVQETYGVTVANRNNNPRTYLITATPIAGTSQAADGALTLNELGEKTPAGKW